MNARVGFGFDVHQLKDNQDFWLGGIKIPHYKGAIGHSDGDVLIHAICDALLGALGLGDIGVHFPDNSTEFKNIDSKILLEKTSHLITREGYTIVNIDTTVCLQRPKIQSFISSMKKTLAHVMNINSVQLSIKATTTEGLGFVGEEKGVSACAVVLLEKK